MDSETIKLMLQKIHEAKSLGRQLGFPNILYNEQYKELEIASVLSHTYNEGQGPDAYTADNEPCEYKSMSGDKGSFQYHWLSQDKVDKLKRTPHHYFAIYDKSTAELHHIYYIHIQHILPEIIKAFDKGERERLLLHKTKNIGAHKSFSLQKLIKLGATRVYPT